VVEEAFDVLEVIDGDRVCRAGGGNPPAVGLEERKERVVGAFGENKNGFGEYAGGAAVGEGKGGGAALAAVVGGEIDGDVTLQGVLQELWPEFKGGVAAFGFLKDKGGDELDGAALIGEMVVDVVDVEFRWDAGGGDSAFEFGGLGVSAGGFGHGGLPVRYLETACSMRRLVT
jgi:hypothetical protein